MKQRPILFSTPMVQAILEGRKTQTRRVIKVQPDENGIDFIPHAPSLDWEQHYKEEWKPWVYDTNEGERIGIHCPYGEIGDVLWVRETWAAWQSPAPESEVEYIFRADQDFASTKWKPSIFMPREACRLFLEITNVRVERLQDISEEDAEKEGIEQIEAPQRDGDKWIYKSYTKGTYEEKQLLPLYPYCSFKTLWQSINGRESWDSNPFVWVVDFKKVEI